MGERATFHVADVVAPWGTHEGRPYKINGIMIG